MVLSGHIEEMHKRIVSSGLAINSYELITSPPEEIPEILLGADLGISFLRLQTFAHRIASPVKMAEYLACGLPVVINPGIGDTSRIIQTYRVGIIVNPDDPEYLEQSVNAITEMIDNDPGLSSRCREAALQELSSELSCAKI